MFSTGFSVGLFSTGFSAGLFSTGFSAGLFSTGFSAGLVSTGFTAGLVSTGFTAGWTGPAIGLPSFSPRGFIGLAKYDSAGFTSVTASEKFFAPWIRTVGTPICEPIAAAEVPLSRPPTSSLAKSLTSAFDLSAKSFPTSEAGSFSSAFCVVWPVFGTLGVGTELFPLYNIVPAPKVATRAAATTHPLRPFFRVFFWLVSCVFIIK